MPPNTCRKCGLRHYNFQACAKGEEYEAEAALKANRDLANLSITRFKGPDGFTPMTGFGTSNAPKPGVLLKTGSLIYPKEVK